MPLSLFAPIGLVIALAGAGLFWRTERRRLATTITALGVIMVVVVIAAIVGITAQPN